jgi:K+-sensing histidine kinase KdpD
LQKTNSPRDVGRDDVVTQFRRYLPVLSHDVRSPMTAIKGAVSLLSSGLVGTLDEKQLRFLDMCDRNSDLATLLVQDVVDLMRLSSETMETFPSEMHVANEVRSCLDRVGAKTELTTELALPSDDVQITTDRSSFGRLVGALIRLPHAIKEITHARLGVAQDGSGIRFSLVCGPVESTPTTMIEEVARSQHQIEGRIVATGLEIHIVQAMADRLNLEFTAKGGSGDDMCVEVLWPDGS